MLGDDDWLGKFIEDYKVKLAEEKRELFSTHVNMTDDRQQRQHDFSPTPLAASKEKSKIIVPSKSEQFDQEKINFSDQPSDGVRNSDHSDAVERKKKQEEYRRILDQQLAEHKQRKEEELRRWRREETDDFGMTSNLNTDRRSLIRSPSPPIKSHYRKPVQVRVPSRPLTAEGDHHQRLSDLTELRQLYSNR
ncbi:uncharacterized protein LOC130690274 isoform X2 [Daphnia carinata]|uniref:uncharacterized protein LOC130690274 isoform X2 n=1 Tax=Daphnia carinata TaxID=120202 RepID=UPI00257BF3E3|nr:uncharacterized protein LOC130690274 isoform X2 [Daphnia carinata]